MLKTDTNNTKKISSFFVFSTFLLVCFAACNKVLLFFQTATILF